MEQNQLVMWRKKKLICSRVDDVTFVLDHSHECSSQTAGGTTPSSSWIFISLSGDNTKSQSNKKTNLSGHTQFLSRHQLQQRTKTRLYNCTKWTDKQKHHRAVCLLDESNSKRPEVATDTRRPQIQNESTVSDYCHHQHHHHRSLIRSCLPVTHV